MDITPDVFLNKLLLARWHVALKTYGSNHATLVGLLVDWWITQCPDNNWTLEGEPSNGLSEAGLRGQCDALLCRDGIPVGVLEVEGSRKVETTIKIGSFFDAKKKEYLTLKFGILVYYSYEPSGRGEMRKYEQALTPDVENTLINVSRNHKNKPIIVISIDKSYNYISEGVRSYNDYYKGSIKTITADYYMGGVALKKEIIYSAS